MSRLRRLSGNASVTLYTKFWKCGTFMRLGQQALILQSCRCLSAYPLVLGGCRAALFLAGWFCTWGRSGDAARGSFHSPHHAPVQRALEVWGARKRVQTQPVSRARLPRGVHRCLWASLLRAACLWLCMGSAGHHGVTSVSCAGRVQGC